MNISNLEGGLSATASGPKGRRGGGRRLGICAAAAAVAVVMALPSAATAQGQDPVGRLCPGGYIVFGGGPCPASPPPSNDPGPPLSAVPEPDAWALLIVGFFSLGAALRHRRRREAAS